MSNLALTYSALAVAILCEVAGTTFLQKSEQFTKIGSTLAMATLYACAFYALSHALKTMPLGVAYAIWCGVGIILSAIIGATIFRQSLDIPAMIGIGMIVGGVVVMQVFSTTTSH